MNIVLSLEQIISVTGVVLAKSTKTKKFDVKSR